MEKELEELAKRLAKMIYISDYYENSKYAQSSMFDLAKEVKIIELEARLDEQDNYWTDYSEVEKRIIRKAELKSQLNELKG